MAEARVLIAGDLCPIFRGRDTFLTLSSEQVFGGLAPVIREADLSITNLECPLIRSPSPIGKVGHTLSAPTECARRIRMAGFSVVNMANNHIRDHGGSGVLSTIEACRGEGLPVVGAGASPPDARRVLTQTIAGIRVGVLGACEHEFSIVGIGRPGANPIDPSELWKETASADRNWDVLVVLLHSGMGDYPYPTPKQQALCRHLVDLGAAAVICQHSHCPGAYETYRNGLIVYGQGNLFFDWEPSPGRGWHQGFAIRLWLGPDGMRRFEFAPFVQCRDEAVVRTDDRSENDEIMGGVEERSREILEDGRVAELWEEHCRRETLSYLTMLQGNRFHHRILGRLFGPAIMRRWFPRGHSAQLLLNLVRCETHREVLETVLSEQAEL